MISYLVSKDANGKVRVCYIYCSEKWDDELGGYIITRTTGIIRGKKTSQPNIIVGVGKAKRTVKEQLQLQYDHLVKEKIDKGYKALDVDPETISSAELDEILGEIRTGGQGEIKPMLAKSYRDIKSKNIWDRPYMISPKINGVRATMFWDGSEIHTASRGAMNYDLAVYHIISHPALIEFFKNNPNIILDGELYTVGETLNKISGVCRKQKTIDEGNFINYYIYDIIDLEKSFMDRFDILRNIAHSLNLRWCNPENPIINWREGELKCVMVPHYPVSGWDAIKSYHDKWVASGWEGAVCREASSLYKPGIRNNDWIKIKQYIDSEYPIVGWEPGLRDEDMCFVCETPMGHRFNVKPMGTREQKNEYLANMDKIIGKMLTIKYFEMSGAGTDIPQQPVGIAIRDYE